MMITQDDPPSRQQPLITGELIYHMLYEIPQLRQSNRSLLKRWFSSRDMDLFVWFHDSVPVQFQLAYNKRSTEKAISWNFQRGLHHYLVDSGEIALDHYKQTPILIGLCDQKNLASIARDFLAASDEMDIGLADFIYARLLEHPTAASMHGAVHTDLSAPH